MRAPLLAILVLLLAGCARPEPEALAAAETAPSVTIDEARPDTAFTPIALTPAAADLDATLAAPPRWVPGEWWKIRFTSPLTGEEVDFVRVVAAVDGDDYVVGMPHEGWYKEAVVYHVPCFGDVVGATLGCRAHNIPFEPVKFPLTDGATWTTNFQTSAELTATVKVLSSTEASITYVNANGATIVEAVYDATIHDVRSFKHSTAVYEVVEHGYGFEGWVTVPRGEELVFLHGRFATPVLSIFQEPALPVESVTVSGGYNRLSFILAAGNVLGPGVGGAYSEKATAPDGTVYEHSSIPGAPLTITFFEAKEPDGEWQLEHVAAGPGIAFIEGIAYHQYDIRLPDGAIRADHSHEVIR